MVNINKSTPPHTRSSRKNKILLGTLVPISIIGLVGTGLGVGYAIWHHKHTPISNAKSLSITGLTELLIPFKTTYEYKCNVADATITAEGLPSGFSFNGHTLNTPDTISTPGTFILNAKTNNGLTCSRTISYFSGDCNENNKCILMEGGVKNPNVEPVPVDVADGILSVTLTDAQKKLVTGVYFTNITSAYTSVGADFLYGCTALTSIDLSPLSNVNSIGDRFLYYCFALTSIDLSPLLNVNSVGYGFLFNCHALTSIDLSPLSNVNSIGDWFLCYCYSLTSIDLSPLSNVNSIGDWFLVECFGLTSIDLSPLSNVNSIGNTFLAACLGLTSIDLSPLSKVNSIGNSFLSSCYTLTSIDLSPLSKVNSIGDEFLSNCYSLTSIDLSPLLNVNSVGDKFLSNCSALTYINVGNINFSGKFDTTSTDLYPLENITNSNKSKIVGSQGLAFKQTIDQWYTNASVSSPISNWTVVS